MKKDQRHENLFKVKKIISVSNLYFFCTEYYNSILLIFKTIYFWTFLIYSNENCGYFQISVRGILLFFGIPCSFSYWSIICFLPLTYHSMASFSLRRLSKTIIILTGSFLGLRHTSVDFELCKGKSFGVF